MSTTPDKNMTNTPPVAIKTCALSTERKISEEPQRRDHYVSVTLEHTQYVLLLAHDAFVKQIFALLPWCLSVCLCVCLSGTDVRCDHTVHFSADLSLRLDSPIFWAPLHQSMSTYFQPSFSSSTWNRNGVWMCKLGLNVNTNSDKQVVCRWI